MKKLWTAPKPAGKLDLTPFVSHKPLPPVHLGGMEHAQENTALPRSSFGHQVVLPRTVSQVRTLRLMTIPTCAQARLGGAAGSVPDRLNKASRDLSAGGGPCLPFVKIATSAKRSKEKLPKALPACRGAERRDRSMKVKERQWQVGKTGTRPTYQD